VGACARRDAVLGLSYSRYSSVLGAMFDYVSMLDLEHAAPRASKNLLNTLYPATRPPPTPMLGFPSPDGHEVASKRTFGRVGTQRLAARARIGHVCRKGMGYAAVAACARRTLAHILYARQRHRFRG
jgi:hypothetical protein